ncbi:hypothetical protein PIB30_094070 [Stylosanthes scabra]|uniref:Uncharacterized protein n=1 Tax=Stylosanthes scabra TaxID=79078 RepID=A0ABU6TUX2_9FABA|nr:hypothetical protein [Stylosanthes scabra]
MPNKGIDKANESCTKWQNKGSIWMVRTKYRRGRTKQESPSRLNQALAFHAYA